MGIVHNVMWIRYWGNATEIWSKKDKKTGKTKWDRLTYLASEGWELVDVTSITLGGTTSEILYTFKKPVEESSSMAKET